VAPPDQTAPPIFLLCDFAEVLNAKLYVMGAGFDRVSAGGSAAMALAMLWSVPWEMTGRQHSIEMSLVTDDGDAYLDGEANPVKVTGTIDVGRPEHLGPGSTVPTPLAIRLPPIPFAEGGYSWELAINGGEIRAAAHFLAISPAE
jgi:hypothetical protein